MNVLERFFSELSAKKKCLFLLDYDGTLAPLLADRSQAFPYEGVKERLQDLSECKNYRMVIISGRSLEDLERFLKSIDPRPELWGSHGLEHLNQSGQRKCEPVDPSIQEGLQKALEACLLYFPSQRCEIKPFGIAFHWRGIDEKAREKIKQVILPDWEKITQAYPLHIYQFDGGLELKPRDRNKGDVVKELLQNTPSDVPVVYMGDDQTDEDAFKVLGERGLKVLVRKEFRPTLADVHLVPPEELLTFFDRCKSMA